MYAAAIVPAPCSLDVEHAVAAGPVEAPGTFPAQFGWVAVLVPARACPELLEQQGRT